MKPRVQFDSPEIIEAVYEAVIDQSLWDSILRTLTKEYNACVGFMGVSQEWVEILPVLYVGLTPSLFSLFASHFNNLEKNQLNRAVVQKKRYGSVYRTEDALPLEELHKTELYERVIRHTGSEYGIGIQLAISDASFGGLAIYRDLRAGPFAESDLDSMRNLVPHVLRSIQMMSRLVEAENRARLVCEALDRLGFPVLVADADYKIRYSNAAARAVLTAKDGLRAARGRLEARCTGENSRLRGFIRGAALCHRDGHRHAGGSISITRPDGRPSWEVVVAPLSAARVRHNWPAGDLAIVISKDPASKPVSPEQYMQKRFALTPAEARVAVLIGEGGSLKELAERLEVSVNTVRTHLQRVFEKTRTRRQAELARLISSHPARVLLPR